MVMSRRTSRGNAMVEFAPALVVFVCFVLTPLLDISFIPVRYMIACGVANEFAHRLSLCEKRSDCYSLLGSEPWTSFLSNCGVTVQDPKLTMVVCGTADGDKVILNPGQPVPAAYLPGGGKGPCLYSLELRFKANIAPLFNAGGGLPGFTGPVAVTVCSRSNWENFGKNPYTDAFYINE